MKLTVLCLLVLLPSITLSIGDNTKAKGWFPEIRGYDLEENYPLYIPGNLWDYINGAADTYLSYDFVDLNIAEYINKSGESIKVEIYKHESPEYAYGIYCSERFPDYNFIEIGAQGYAEKGLVHFVTGPYYVKVISGSETPSEIALLEVANEISHWLDQEYVLPKMLSVFPLEGRLEMSECFLSNNFLGHEFLSDAYVSRYEIEDQEFTIFIMEKESPSECIQVIEDYMRFAKMVVPAIANSQYDIEDRYNGDVTLILESNLIIGFLDCRDQSFIDKYSQLIKDKL